MEMTSYLGQHVSSMLASDPFKNWYVDRTADQCDDQVTITYQFCDNGLEVRCDSNEFVRTIFMYANEFGGFDEDLIEFSFLLSRDEVIRQLGMPSKSGERMTHPILGECGAWDRYDYTDPDISAHFEYRTNEHGIRKITLMRGDAVPDFRE